jgi:hypothetical protein
MGKPSKATPQAADGVPAAMASRSAPASSAFAP